MKSGERIRKPINYDSFSNNAAGLASMIFVQAVLDAAMLQKHGTTHLPDHNGGEYTLEDIIIFCRSEWADYLAWVLRLDIRDVRRWAANLEVSS